MRTPRFRPLLSALLLLFLAAVPALAAQRALVLPLQPAPGSAYDGQGPGLQNVLENVLAVHPALEESYLLKYIHLVFADGGGLQSYMTGRSPSSLPMAAMTRAGARFIVSGSVLPVDGYAEVKVLDVMTGRYAAAVLTVDTDNGLVAFRKGFMDLFGFVSGLPFPVEQARMALTPDAIGHDALAAFGLSYGAYMLDSFLRGGARLGLPLAREAYASAPKSYLAGNMLAWQLYASGERSMSTSFFKEALTRDPNGVDALDGMLHVAAASGGIQAALPWALRKSKVRGGDTGPALSALHVTAGKQALEAKKLNLAVRHFTTAAALDPAAIDPAWELALSLRWQKRIPAAFKALDKPLTFPALPAIRAEALNRKAQLAAWIANDDKKSGRLDEARKGFDVAMSFLRQSPMPNLNLYAHILMELAAISLDKGEPDNAVKFLELIQPAQGIDPLLVDAQLVRARARAISFGDASDGARLCVRAVAERRRTLEPVPPKVYEVLKDALTLMGETELAWTLQRFRQEVQTEASPQVRQPVAQ